MYQIDRFGKHRLLYRARISNYVKTGLFDKALQTFDEMVQSSCRVFSIDYNRLIGVLVRQSGFDLAEHYYNAMVPQGFSLSSFTYSRFISGLCKVRNFELIQKLLQDMDRIGVVPDMWACNIYLNLLCSENLVDIAIEIDFSSLVDVRIVEHGNSDPAKAVTSRVDKVPMCNTDSVSSAVPKNNDKQTVAPTPEKEGNVWDEISKALNKKMAQLSQENGWNRESSGRSPWSYRALRKSALGPTMALLISQRDISECSPL